MQQDPFATLPEELRTQIYEIFFATSSPTNYLPFRASCKEFRNRLQSYIVKEHLPNLYLELNFHVDMENEVGPYMYNRGLMEYGIPMMQRHWERCRTPEEQATTYKAVLKKMARTGDWEPGTTIDDFMASHELNVFSEVFEDENTSVPNEYIWKAMFGDWVELHDYPDPFGGWGELQWELCPEMEGEKVVFKGPEDVTPFGIGIGFVEFDLIARLSGIDGVSPLASNMRLNFDGSQSQQLRNGHPIGGMQQLRFIIETEEGDQRAETEEEDHGEETAAENHETDGGKGGDKSQREAYEGGTREPAKLTNPQPPIICGLHRNQTSDIRGLGCVTFRHIERSVP
ncbi:hypothetical protein HDV00_000338 [Rhizophlyctis rosea]|nr:hypothetical protein HDV00_000338 [Rhizophlyctis rosea]